MDKFKLIIKIIFVIAVLTFVYKLGESHRLEVSYDSKYEKVDAQNNPTEVEGSTPDVMTMYSYVPAYSHIYTSTGKPLEMAVTLSLRNADQEKRIKINKISYYNTRGQLIRFYLKDGYDLAPLETKEVFIKMDDIEGGSGANFIIKYSKNQGALNPIFEAIMVATTEKSSFVFSSRGENHPYIFKD